MLTVPEATKKIVLRSRFLTEAMSKNIINNSALARYIKPELEEILLKDVSESAVIMALNRLSAEIEPKYSSRQIFDTHPAMATRSNLFSLTVDNSKNIDLNSLLVLAGGKETLLVNLGIFETTIVASDSLKNKITDLLGLAEANLEELSSITIDLPEVAGKTPGVYYFFIKSLAWEGINIVELVSTETELTLIFESKDLSRALSVLQSLFTKSVI